MVEGGVLNTSRVRPLIVGRGNGGRIGEEPPSSAVEVVENAGETARSIECVKGVPGVFSAGAGGGGEDGMDGILSIFAEWTVLALENSRQGRLESTDWNETSADESTFVYSCLCPARYIPPLSRLRSMARYDSNARPNASQSIQIGRYQQVTR